MGNPVVHFEVVGKDANALQNFYKRAFGWEMQSMMPEYAMARPGGQTGINGGVGQAMGGSPGHVTFYIAVDDLGAALKKVESLGGRKVSDPMDIPNGPSIAMFTDPEGHLIGLVKGM
jgi:predicted enzyme related to lactoylglutathione lyase